MGAEHYESATGGSRTRTGGGPKQVSSGSSVILDKPARYTQRSNLADAWLIAVVLATPIMVAVVNPGTGYFSGFYLGAAAAAALLVVKFKSAQADAVGTLMVVVLGFYIALTPYLVQLPVVDGSPARSAGVSVLFFAATYLAVDSIDRLKVVLGLLTVLGSVYAIYFLANSSIYDAATSRAAVSFSNANYSGFVFAVTGTFAALSARLASSRMLKLIFLCAWVATAVACFSSGSRSALAGLLLSSMVVVFVWHRWNSVFSILLACFTVMMFFGAALPVVARVLLWASYGLSTIPVLERGTDALANLSGRESIWPMSIEAFLLSPITGWGPNQYYRILGQSSTFLTHSWGLEYLASVGVVGTIGVVIVLRRALFVRRDRSERSLDTVQAALLIAILPALVLNTFQWNIWAWFVFGLAAAVSLLGAKFSDREHGKMGEREMLAE